MHLPAIARRLLPVIFGLIGALPLAAHATIAVVVRIDGAIGPAIADYVQRGIQAAETADAACVILVMDTPGGLDKAMRGIIRSILAAKVPVISFVAPQGARAASAGTYILYASHVAAMAPATNLGAATPVSIGGIPTPGSNAPETPSGEPGKAGEPGQGAADGGDAMEHKMVNDAAAYMRSLAQMRGRNAEFAEKSVREARSLSAEDALKAGVIEMIVADLPSLLRQLDGRRIHLDTRDIALATAAATLVEFEPDWRMRILVVLTDPNVAYILMLIGIYGLFLEFYHPGAMLPGIAGAIALLLALYAFQVLPLSFAGLGLLLLGIVLMAFEAFLPSFGVVGVGGIAAFIIGSIMLFDRRVPGFAVALPLVAVLSLLSAAFFSVMLGLALQARRRPALAGAEELLGAEAVAIEDFDGEGRVRIRGEIWRARTDTAVSAGERVIVSARHGLSLHIVKREN